MRIPVLGGAGMVLALLGVAGTSAAQIPAPAPANRRPASTALIGAPDSPAPLRPDTLRLTELIDQARRESPLLRAARLEADAALERVPQPGALPNPQLTFGFKNRPIDNFDTDERMTMNSVGLVQRFPWPGVQGFGKKRAEHLAEASRFDAAEADRQLVARLSAVYYRIAYLDRALTIMGDTRGLLRSFLEVAEARYAVGDGLQQDVLQAQVSIARMTEDITVAEQSRIALAARINALVGRSSEAPVGSLRLPAELPDLPAADSLTALAVGQRPSLAAALERVEAAEAGYRAARRKLYPDITLKVEYGQRPQFVDFLTVLVGVEIPLWAGQRELPLRREMDATRLREQARARDLYNETVARVLELRAEADRARKLARLYAASVIPQAQAAVESALAAYRVGEVDYMTLVENELTVNRYEIQTVSLRADYHRAVAELAALIGGAPGGTQ